MEPSRNLAGTIFPYLGMNSNGTAETMLAYFGMNSYGTAGISFVYSGMNQYGTQQKLGRNHFSLLGDELIWNSRNDAADEPSRNPVGIQQELNRNL